MGPYADLIFSLSKEYQLIKHRDIAASLAMAALTMVSLAVPGACHAQSRGRAQSQLPAYERPQGASDTPSSTANATAENLDLAHSGPRRLRAASAMSAKLRPFELLPAPAQLTYTNDAAACVAHAGGGGSSLGIVGGLVCKSLVPQGKLVLIWNYPRNAVIQGFRVYESVAGGPEQLLATQDPGVTLYLPDPPQPGGYAGACFRVTALTRNQESRPSDWFCGARARLIHTVLLKPIIVRSSTNGNDESHGTSSLDYQEKYLTGYIFDTGTDSGVNWYNNYIFRGGVLFDPSQLSGHKIFSAKLRLQVEWSCSTADSASKPQSGDCVDQFTNCGALLFEGSPDHPWWRDRHWIDIGPPIATAIPKAGPVVVIDVTRSVQGWLSGRPNVGLVMAGDNENLVQAAIRPDTACHTNYVRDSIALEVSYFDAAPSPTIDDVDGLRLRRPH